jgi:multidrug efflux system outer membrane protein
MYKPNLLLAVLLLAACTQMPELQRQSPPVPVVWPDGSGSSPKQRVTQIHWSAFFTDPRLQALIAKALDHNRDLRIAAARVQEARAQFGMAQAERLPSAYLFPPLDTRIVTVSYEVDFWGRVSGLSDSARANVLATEEARRAVSLSLVADVAQAYFAQLHLDELIEIMRTTIDLREESLVLVRKGRDLGGTYDYEVQQATGILESTRSSLTSLEYQRAAAENRLNFLVGQVPERLPQGRTLDEQALDTMLAPGLPAEVLLLRPDVMASEQRLYAAHANIGVARTAFFPKIALTAGLGVASQGLASLVGAGAWSFSPSVSLPALFDGGRTAAGVEVAEVREVIAVAEYERTIQQAFREVADLLSARASLASQLRATLANTDAQKARLQIAQARHKAGLVSYLDVLDSQREFLASQQQSIQLRRAQLDAAAQLYKALGGGEPTPVLAVATGN